MNGMDGGTALKPSYEPIILARKKFKGSCIDNVIKWGVGGINIDECRVETQDNLNGGGYSNNTELMQNNIYGEYKKMSPENYKQPSGRFPANTILSYDQITFDEVCGGFPNTKGEIGRAGRKTGGEYNASSYKVGVVTDYGFKDEGSASRYFYCAKASKKDREEGLEEFEQQKVNDGRKKDADNAFQRGATLRHNIHPTVKPTELMQYLIRLVTPNDGTILDPFMRKRKYRESSNV